MAGPLPWIKNMTIEYSNHIFIIKIRILKERCQRTGEHPVAASFKTFKKTALNYVFWSWKTYPGKITTQFEYICVTVQGKYHWNAKEKLQNTTKWSIYNWFVLMVLFGFVWELPVYSQWRIRSLLHSVRPKMDGYNSYTAIFRVFGPWGSLSNTDHGGSRILRRSDWLYHAKHKGPIWGSATGHEKKNHTK